MTTSLAARPEAEEFRASSPVLCHHRRVLRMAERSRSFDPIAIANAIDTRSQWPTGWPRAALVGPTLGHADPPVGRFGPPVGHPASTLIEPRETG